jgi:8-oxo-dGTP pyrophosphatase MutT (NUDIX family)
MSMDREHRLRCDNRLRHHMESNLSGFHYLEHKGAGLRQAAVAITVVCADGMSHQNGPSSRPMHDRDAALILTRRSARLKHHAGQWAIPGGRVERGEAPEYTALRELGEEVNLQLPKSRILGRLDDFATRSGFVITPVVVWGGSEVDLRPNPEEVRSVHRIPIQEFLRPDAPMLEDNPHNQHPILYMPVGRTSIATPTAALLYQFREVAILGRKTRVAHFEQPMFAWR